MKQLSIRLKITIWFSAVLVLMVGLTYGVIFFISGSVLQKTIQDNLIEIVEDNVDEIEYFELVEDMENDQDSDHYIEYKGGYLEIDDDFLNQVNGITTALYNKKGTLLYGENPIASKTADIKYKDAHIQKTSVKGTTYYIYDRELTQSGIGGLWLRGIVSEEQGTAQLHSVVNISLVLLPLLMLLAIVGGYLLAGKMLAPIKEISNAALEIGQGHDLKKRIELGEGQDELHQLANTFDEMFERLDEAFEAERQFTSDASHELRTPMSVILAQCEFTLERARTAKEYEDAIKLIQRQGKKMSRLISDMLDVTRLEQKGDTIEREQVNVTELVTLLCEDMALIRENEITLTYEVAPNVFLYGNYQLLSRMLANLITNAYRYGKEQGHIEVKLTKDEKKLVLSVSDDGIGIAKEEQDKIFRRFYQSDTSRTRQGTGLGLSMVREIASLHGGTIEVQSELGQGSTFTFIVLY